MRNETEPPVERLSRSGRAIRVAVALLVMALMMVGNQWGSDDHFPLGPFKMYVSSDEFDAFYPYERSDPMNSLVRDTRIVGTNAEGDWLYLHQANTGFRRAEVEGQLPRLQRDPRLLGALAKAYERRRPERPRLVRIVVVVRWWEIEDRRLTGRFTDEHAVVWTAHGGAR